MIEKILRKRKYVLEFDQNANIPPKVINKLLKKTWEVTPSKNNFMPYTVHVLGPEHQDYKESVFLNCASNEGLNDGVENPLELRYKEHLPNYGNILTCSYLFIFTLRLEDKPNPFQQYLIENGRNYEAVDENRLNNLYPIASLEVGMFADCFSALCLQNGIDVSYTGCFHKNLDKWSDVPFVTRKPILIMTAGKGKVYRIDKAQKSPIEKQDWKPNYDRIVNFI